MRFHCPRFIEKNVKQPLCITFRMHSELFLFEITSFSIPSHFRKTKFKFIVLALKKLELLPQLLSKVHPIAIILEGTSTKHNLINPCARKVNRGPILRLRFASNPPKRTEPRPKTLNFVRNDSWTRRAKRLPESPNDVTKHSIEAKGERNGRIGSPPRSNRCGYN